jgi:hypothetical protein
MNDTIQISTQTLNDFASINSQFTPKDWTFIVLTIANIVILAITAYIVSKSPQDSVDVGRKLFQAQEHDRSKRELFMTLFSLRGHPHTRDFINALNRVDVVFHDNPKILEAWHQYFDLLHKKEEVNIEERWKLSRTNLIEKMAKSLGYNLESVDIHKNYYSEGQQKLDDDQIDFWIQQKEYYRLSNLALRRGLNMEDGAEDV